MPILSNMNVYNSANARSSNNWSTASNASDTNDIIDDDNNNNNKKWNTKINLQKFLLRIPKADLHIHLDGSIRIETLIDLAQQSNVELPSYDAQELKDLVFPQTYNSLEEYLRGFGYITQVLTTPEALERVAYEVTMDAYNCGVRHIEVRFAPQMHAIPGKFSIEQVVCAVNKGMERAVRDADELDQLSRYLYRRGSDEDVQRLLEPEGSIEYVSQLPLDEETKEKIQHLKEKQGMHPYHPNAPPHQYGIIACAMRFFLPVFSPYYEAFCEVHKGEDAHRVFGLASVALVTAVNNLRRKGKCCHDCDSEECPACSTSDQSDDISSDSDGLNGYILPVVALDIAGAEVGYPASDHREAFDLAHQSFLHKTVHAGEAYGPESIMEAVTDLHAERIGHGCNLFKWEIIGEGEGRVGKRASSSSKNRNDMTDIQKQQYCENLTRYLGTMRLCIEVCLSSNLQTIPELDGDLRKHPAKKMIQEGLAVALCTDNTLVSRTDIVRELSLAVEAFHLTPVQLRDIVFNGFKRSFMPKRYSAKREYNRQVISYYKLIEEESGLDGYGSEYGE